MWIWIDFRGVPQGFLSQSLTTQIVINKTLQIDQVEIVLDLYVYKIVQNIYKKLYKIYVSTCSATIITKCCKLFICEGLIETAFW